MLHSSKLYSLKEGACTLFFVLRQRPRTSLQCFALYKQCSKAKHCRHVLGRCLRTKNKIENPSLRPSDQSSVCSYCVKILLIVSIFISLWGLVHIQFKMMPYLNFFLTDFSIYVAQQNSPFNAGLAAGLLLLQARFSSGNR